MPEYILDTHGADHMLRDLDPFTLAYIECLFFTGIQDADGRDLDLGLVDLAGEALTEIRADCAAFQADHADLLAGADPTQAGHDFWLTRNGHGAGFWDRGKGVYPNDPNGAGLTAAAEVYGTSDTYVGDDGMVYVS